MDTATIRVSTTTRNLLAEQAKERGVSISTLVANFAQTSKREALFAAERDASLRDMRNEAARAEDSDWEETLTQVRVSHHR